MADTDIKIVFSPQDAEKVSAALRRIRDEAVRTGRDGGRGMALLSNALVGLKRMLPALGIGAVTVGFVGLTRQAFRQADAMGKLGQRVGATAADLAVLAHAATKADVSQEQLGTGLQRLARFLDEARSGSRNAVEALRRVGLTVRDLEGLDTGRAFVRISQAMGGCRTPRPRPAWLWRSSAGRAPS
ncbi:MAG: hypothetical protein ACNA8S_15800 [Deferrisomatales bacterium]